MQQTSSTHLTSLWYDVFVLEKLLMNFWLICIGRFGWLENLCLSNGWHVHSCQGCHNMLGSFSEPHPGWTQWMLSSFWPKRELSWQMMEDARCQLPHSQNNCTQMKKFPLLYDAAAQLSATSALGLTMWWETVRLEGSDDPRGQTEHGNLAANNGVFDVIKLGTFHQNARETWKRRRHQCQPSSWASEKTAIACCKVLVNGREFTALVDSGWSQMLVSNAMCRRWRQKEVGVLTADRRILKCRGYDKIKPSLHALHDMSLIWQIFAN